MADEQYQAPQPAPQPVPQPAPQPAPQPIPPQGMPQQSYVDSDSTLTMGQWVLNLFLTYIPVVNIIMLLIWAFGSTTAPAKKNWARANLIWVVIGIVLSTIFYVTVFAAILAAGGYGSSY